MESLYFPLSLGERAGVSLNMGASLSPPIRGEETFLSFNKVGLIF
jgi:hypothetical protein